MSLGKRLMEGLDLRVDQKEIDAANRHAREQQTAEILRANIKDGAGFEKATGELIEAASAAAEVNLANGNHTQAQRVLGLGSAAAEGSGFINPRDAQLAQIPEASVAIEHLTPQEKPQIPAATPQP